MDISKLRFYSIGIVVKDKESNTSKVEVCPIEHVPDVEGQISEDKTISHSSVDRTGQVKTTTLKVKNSVEAKWLPFGLSNRATAPDVKVNETVMLFTYADTQEYYWTTMFQEPLLRRLEHVVYQYNNRSDRPTESTADLDSSYSFTISTRDKYVHFKACSNDGEFTQYDIYLDTREGSLLIDDNTGNNILLHSPSRTLTINTNEKVIVNTTDVTVNASNSTTVNTTHATVNASNDATLNTTHATVNASSDATVTTMTATVNTQTGVVNASASVAVTAGSSISLTAPAVTITGETTVMGNLTVAGALSSSLGIAMPGAISISSGGISISIPMHSTAPITSASYIKEFTP